MVVSIRRAATPREEQHQGDDGESEQQRMHDDSAGDGDDQQDDCKYQQHERLLSLPAGYPSTLPRTHRVEMTQDVYATARGPLARLASPAAARARARRHAALFPALAPDARVVDIGCGAIGL